MLITFYQPSAYTNTRTEVTVLSKYAKAFFLGIAIFRIKSLRLMMSQTWILLNSNLKLLETPKKSSLFEKKKKKYNFQNKLRVFMILQQLVCF